ncbi:MAG: hypothetical protein OXB86_06210 [Bdellovibrionales bacterium]|nr:hypothetical protein [Bdellovibrionales bacterium]
MMDIFFLSFNESNREKNWLLLKSRFPHSRHIHGVKGVALAHFMCAQLSKTPYFFVVNGDNEILKSFQFQLPSPLAPAVYTWRSLNPVNQLIYGFGGIKLFWKQTAFAFSRGIDVSTSLNIPYKIVPEMASVTHFNASPLEAWRGAFRECVKLSSRCITRQHDRETKERLEIWCEEGRESPFGSYSVLGARQGRTYGLKYRDCPKSLRKINDFQWLKSYFLKNVVSDHSIPTDYTNPV